MDLGDSSNSEENHDSDSKRQRLDEIEIRNQEDEQKLVLEDVKNLGDSSNSEGNQDPDPDPKRQRLDEEEIRNQENKQKLVLVKNDSIEDEKISAVSEKNEESKKKEDFEGEVRSLFDSDSENEENNTWKREAEARIALLATKEESSDSDGVEEEEESEAEDRRRSGKTKEEQLQMMIDSFQNKDLFKSDGDDLSEDEFGCHEMTCQEYVKYNFEIRKSGGFEVSCYPNVFACGMIAPYYHPPDIKLDPNELDELTSYAQKALNKFNKKKNTNYCNVRVLKANSVAVAGILYYVTFEAANDSCVRTFRAEVYEGIPIGGIPRIKIPLIRLCK